VVLSTWFTAPPKAPVSWQQRLRLQRGDKKIIAEFIPGESLQRLTFHRFPIGTFPS